MTCKYPVTGGIPELAAAAELRRIEADRLERIAGNMRKGMERLRTMGEMREVSLQVDIAETEALEAKALWRLADARLRQARLKTDRL